MQKYQILDDAGKMVLDVGWIIAFRPFLQQRYEFLNILSYLQWQMSPEIIPIHYNNLKLALFGKIKIIGVDKLTHIGLLPLVVYPHFLRDI
jgi:hypothetical protein